jgi:iron complex outermembrane recepter protein
MPVAHALTPLAAAIALSLFSPLALAQATAQAEAEKAEAEKKKALTKLETVVVTSGKRNELAHRLPYNVTAQSEQQLRDDNITDLKKLIAASPSIDAPQNSARFTDSVTVRGLNISPVNANNIEFFTRSTLAFYLDDAQLPNIGFRIKDIARVETLLGPQGTLYGGGSLGGTIRYITNKPQLGKFSGRASFAAYRTGDSDLSTDIDAVLNAPLGERLALRVSVARLDEKGYTDRYAGTPNYLTSRWTPKPDANRVVYEDDDWAKVDTARLSLLWRITPNVDVRISHGQQSGMYHGSSGTQLLPAATSPIAARYLAPKAFGANDIILSPYEEFTDRDIRISSFDLEWKLPGLGRLTSSTSSYKDSRVGQGDYLSAGSLFYGTFGYPRFRLGSSSWAGNTAYMTYDNNNKGTLHETRLVSDPGVVSWIAGLYVASQERSQQFSEWMPGLQPLKAPGRGRNDEGYMENLGSKFRETALYGEVNWKATDQLTLSGGARWFNYKDDATTIVEDYAFDIVTGTLKNKEEGKNKSYFKLNAAYQMTPDLLTYATFSQGFRRGGANGFRNLSNQSVNEKARAYRPDTTDNLELGIKGFVLDRQVYFQASVYQITWKDVQTYFSQDVDGFPVNGTVNGPKAETKGVELQGRWRFAPGMELEGSSTLSEGKWAGTERICLYANNTECRTYTEGGVLGGTSKWRHRVGLRWNGEYEGHSVSARLGARYVGVKPSDRGDSPDALVFSFKSYTTYRASVGIGKGDWDFSAWIDNLTNQRELVSFQGGGTEVARAGLRAIYLTPRTIGLSGTYRFN